MVNSMEFFAWKHVERIIAKNGWTREEFVTKVEQAMVEYHEREFSVRAVRRIKNFFDLNKRVK